MLMTVTQYQARDFVRRLACSPYTLAFKEHVRIFVCKYGCQQLLIGELCSIAFHALLTQRAFHVLLEVALEMVRQKGTVSLLSDSFVFMSHAWTNV